MRAPNGCALLTLDAEDVDLLGGDGNYAKKGQPVVIELTSLDVPIPFSPPLEKAAIASDAQIEAAVRELAGH